MTKKITVSVSGESGAGKTTFLQRIEEFSKQLNIDIIAIDFENDSLEIVVKCELNKEQYDK